jgi:hypothetical protein
VNACENGHATTSPAPRPPARALEIASAAAILALTGAWASPAWAIDEIQVYNAGIVAPGQFAIQQHYNYVGIGQKDPPFPGGFASNHSLNGTPEFAYGLTDWWELGLYLPFAVQDDRFLSDTFKVRTLFVTPQADKRTFFYGVNFEFGLTSPQFSQSRFEVEIRPIFGYRKDGWEFIVNPIVDASFGRLGSLDFAPAARVARLFDHDVALGIEYYADFGEIGNFGKLAQQQHTLFGVTDFKLGEFDIDLGVGYGLTPASDRLVVKTIIGYAFPPPGGSADEHGAMAPVNPLSHTAFHSFQP